MSRDESIEVAITGIGLATGLGATLEETWRRLRAGEHAIARLDGERFEGRLGPYHGARIPEIPRVGDAPSPRLIERLAIAAYRDAGLSGLRDSERLGVAVGLSKGWIEGLAAHADRRVERGRYAFWTRWWPDGASRRIAAFFHARGPTLAPVAACATGLVAVLQGADLIRRGVCDVVFAGAVDASLHPLILGAFDRMGTLARVDHDAPGRAIRPWDGARSGFLVGEGGAVFVLERADHARDRGARPFAKLAGGALGSDAHHITDLDPDPATLAGLIARALANAGVRPTEVDYVNVHGTATRVNDPLECRALRMALGSDANRVACSANKAQIGHTLGAAGAVELAIACMAIRDQFVPPTLNLDDPDPACDLDGTPSIGRSRPIGAALKLSLGFGGHLAALVLERWDEAGRGDHLFESSGARIE